MENDEVQLTDEDLSAEPSGQELISSMLLALIELLIDAHVLPSGDQGDTWKYLELRADSIRRDTRAKANATQHAADIWERAKARVRSRESSGRV